MRLTKSLGLAGALIISALVGGTIIGTTLATDEETDPDAGSTGSGAAAYCETFLDAFASELGVERDALVPAGQAAANAAVDAALEAGDITEERATALHERIAAYDGEGCAFVGSFRLGFGHGFGHGLGHGMARGLIGSNVLEAAADTLGVESADLIERASEAESLEALATEQGVAYDDVKASILAAVQADLDAAGVETERSDAVIERLTTWLDAGGQLGERGRFAPFGGGPGRGPWLDRDDIETDGSDA